MLLCVAVVVGFLLSVVLFFVEVLVGFLDVDVSHAVMDEKKVITEFIPK
tara:strand:+ start:57 stop:203 length:147 start_codon:yes stop_codon:yes gene_type:complete